MLLGQAPPTILIDKVVNSPYRDYLEAEFVDSKDRLQDLKQLALFAENYEELSEFLAHTTLQEHLCYPQRGKRKKKGSYSQRYIRPRD
jgi:hypothetical protein